MILTIQESHLSPRTIADLHTQMPVTLSQTGKELTSIAPSPHSQAMKNIENFITIVRLIFLVSVNSYKVIKITKWLLVQQETYILSHIVNI